MEAIVKALRGLRLVMEGMEEAEIKRHVRLHLESAGFAVREEYTFAPRCRADLWVDGVVLELKKQRPPTAAVGEQITRYAATGKITGLILVLERSMHLVHEIHGVPLAVVSLRANWGIAL
jgi:hypothetical protein